jgi:thioredoxin 1
MRILKLKKTVKTLNLLLKKRIKNCKKQEEKIMEIQVDDTNFEKEVLKSELPVLVDYWAQWCGPCLAVGPTVKQIAEEYAGKIKVCKVNVDFAQTTAGKNCVQSIPTLAVFKNGKEAERLVGAVPKQRIEKMIKPYLG